MLPQRNPWLSTALAGSVLCLSLCTSPLFSDGDDDSPDATPAEKKATSSSVPKKSEPKTPSEGKIEDALQLRKLGKYDQAFGKLKEASTLNPSPKIQAELLFRTAETYFVKGQNATKGKLPGVEPDPCYQEAIKVFDELITKFPKEEITPEGLYLKGSSYLVLGDLTNALSAYASAYRDFPGSSYRSKALERVGVCHAGLDNAAAAIKAHQQTLKEFPGRSEAATSKTEKYIRELELVGKPAPPLKIANWIDGVATRGLDTFSGEVVVLIFFATWCQSCKSELPHLRALMNTWSSKGVTFLGICDPDDPKNTESVEVYVKNNNLPFVDVGLDPGSRHLPRYRVSGFPAGVVMDRGGRIRWRGHMAFFPKPLIEKALAEK